MYSIAWHGRRGRTLRKPACRRYLAPPLRDVAPYAVRRRFGEGVQNLTCCSRDVEKNIFPVVREPGIGVDHEPDGVCNVRSRIDDLLCVWIVCRRVENR